MYTESRYGMNMYNTARSHSKERIKQRSGRLFPAATERTERKPALMERENVSGRAPDEEKEAR